MAGRAFRYLLFILFLFLPSSPAIAAGSWSYGITGFDTPGTIEAPNTSAAVDTISHEILLPKSPLANVLSFDADGGLNYAVVTASGVKSYNFDGAQMVENPITSVQLANGVSVALPTPFPDVVVATSTDILYYGFSGSGMTQNPALSVAGLTGVVAVGSQQAGNVAALSGNQARRYLSDGVSMIEVPAMEPAALTNPISLALVGDFDLVVLEPDRVRYFSYDGAGMAETPALAVAGLSNPVAFATDGGTEVAVVDGTQVKHYTFDGGQMVYNSAMSISSGLTSPKAVAIRTGSPDRIIVDGSEVKYYTFDGVGMVYNAALSKVVADIAQGSTYKTSAVAQSQGRDPVVNADQVRVRANLSLPANTTISWSVTANGSIWVTRWRARGTAGGTVAEVTPDNGVTWQPIGSASEAGTTVDRAELWAAVTPGRSVRWRADLATSDVTQTPKVVAMAGTAVTWEADARPSPPTMTVPGWFYTTTPGFSWTFSDPDAGDSQTAFQLQVKRQSDAAPVYDTGKVISGSVSFTLPTSQTPDVPGPLWASGVYAFTVQVRVWDQAGVVSDWSTAYPFKVLAFERPRVAEMISPPVGQVAPDVADPATHIMITPGMAAVGLPKAKAGAKVTLILDSVGPVITTAANVATFPYGEGETAAVGDAAALSPSGSAVNRWTIPFWTEASLETTPTGTVVQLQVNGTGTEGGTTTFNLPPYAAGVIQTQGSIFEDWFVVLQGSEQ